jgi:hypothetical protein
VSMPRSQARVRASPTERRIALTNAWKDAFVGASPMRPRQRG